MDEAGVTLEALHDNRDFELKIPGLKFAHIMRRFEDTTRRGEEIELAKIILSGMQYD